MNRLVPPLQRELRAVGEMPFIVFLRKLELLFYFLFLALATIYIVLPFVTDLKVIPLYGMAGMSILYAIGIYFLRFKMYVHFGWMAHIGVFLIIASSGFFEAGFDKVGTIMAVLGLLGIVMIFVFASLGRKVFVTDSPVEQQLNPLRQEVDLLNHQFQNDQANNVVLPNGHVNHPNQGLPNGHVNHPNLGLPNGHVNHPNPGLPNDHVNHPNPGLPNDHVNHPNPGLPNGHVDHPDLFLVNGLGNHPNPVLGNGPVNNPDLVLVNGLVDLPNLGNGQAVQQPRDEPEEQAFQPRVEVN